MLASLQTIPAPFPPTTQQTNQILLNFAWQAKKNGLAEQTIEVAVKNLKQITKNCTNILDPEQFKTALTNTHWSNNTKKKVVAEYTTLLKYNGITWEKPRFVTEQVYPFIPTEQEIDTLIAACGRTLTIVLQFLKETGVRIGELTKLQWQDIDFQRKTASIRPLKGSNPRILPLTDKLLAMINHIDRNKPRPFRKNTKSLRTDFCASRRYTATKLQNPRLLKIHFHTFRHWKATMEYHKTKDIIHVKTILGHKDITSTMIYINIEQALWLQATDQWTCKVAHNETEAIQLIEAGYEYITDTNQNKLFRKRK
jgi:integrase